jgi:hypothetical protein
MTGYLNPRYAESFSEFGVLRELPRCGGYVLQREIPGFAGHDGMGCYPLFACRDWSRLHADLDDLRHDLVTLALVPDPFGDFDVTYLEKCFDVVRPFKEHFVTDLRQPLDVVVSPHHHRYVRQALKKVRVERCPEPTRFVDDWVSLYANLVERHDLRGIKAMSSACLAKQLEVPGIVMFRAVHQDMTVGIDLWYVQGEVAFGHLAALNSDGYRTSAAYGLLWSAMEHFRDEVRWVHLGAGAGMGGSGTDGLSSFKRGWSTGTRTAYFCGRILDDHRYSEIVEARGVSESRYFPAYRGGEFS